jgi:hypothetical protein
MKDTLTILIFSIALLNIKYPVQGQNNIRLSDYHCFSEPVKYITDGSETEGLLIFINYKEQDVPFHYTNVYLLNKTGYNTQLVGDTAAFIGMYEISVSPDSKYIALSISGEGHPWVEIYDLQQLIIEQKKVLISELNPYPGSVKIIGWKDENLVVESDVDLLLMSEGNEIDSNELFENYKKFIFNIFTRKITEKN